MYKIAIDETGDFEEETGCMTISGFLFGDDSVTEDDISNEARRIDAYYRTLVKEVKASYPHDLHSTGYNNQKVKPVKIMVKKTLPTFLAEGTYNGRQLRDRNGCEIPSRKS